MYEVSASGGLTIAFVLLTALVVATNVVALRLAAPPSSGARWLMRGALFFALWMTLHASIARSGFLESAGSPPPVLPFMGLNLAVALGVALSSAGRRLAGLPFALLIGLQAFRLPLEILLHALFEEGQLPIQMTWSGRNLDVITGASALVLSVAGTFVRLPRAVVWGFAVVGTGLLVNVVGIAVLSTPTPLRVFTEGPPVVLPYSVPWTWIVSVHVWTAVAGQVVIFRALLRRP